MPSVADLAESHLLRSLTDPETYEAGVKLADGGAVRFDELAPLHTRARVRDGEIYVADLRSGAGKLLWSCSEPGGSRGGLCRHCVAAAVATWRRSPAARSSDEYVPDVLEEPGWTLPVEEAASVEGRPGAEATEAATATSEDRATAVGPAVVEPAAVAAAEASAAPEPEPRPAEPLLAPVPEVPPESQVPPEAPIAAAQAPDPSIAPKLAPRAPVTLAPATSLQPIASKASGGITAVHAIVFTPAVEAVRAFFRDTLGLPSVDAGDGWLIFALPPAELAVHPAGEPSQEVYLMCDDLEATLTGLESKGVKVRRPVREEAWGVVTDISLPGGTDLAIYQPKHPSPLKP